MALTLHHSTPPSSFNANKPYLLLHPPSYSIPTTFPIKSQQDYPTEETNLGTSPKKPGAPSQGRGFGSSTAASTAAPLKKKQGNRERASIIRREPVEKPSFATPQQVAQAEELRKNESAFLLAWLGLGSIILIQGIALAASGFLPETWDSFLVKYIYPSFTPTVFLFVAGTVAYGVLKYFQNENLDNEN